MLETRFLFSIISYWKRLNVDSDTAFDHKLMLSARIRTLKTKLPKVVD